MYAGKKEFFTSGHIQMVERNNEVEKSKTFYKKEDDGVPLKRLLSNESKTVKEWAKNDKKFEDMSLNSVSHISDSEVNAKIKKRYL